MRSLLSRKASFEVLMERALGSRRAELIAGNRRGSQIRAAAGSPGTASLLALEGPCAPLVLAGSRLPLAAGCRSPPRRGSRHREPARSQQVPPLCEQHGQGPRVRLGSAVLAGGEDAPFWGQ